MTNRKTENRIRRILDHYEMTEGIDRQTLLAKAIFFKNSLHRDELVKALAVLEAKYGFRIDWDFD